MYTLYWAPNTGAFAPQVILEEAGAAYELISIDMNQGEHRQESYRQLNPLGQVPTLILPEGLILTESMAMILHLADQFPEAGLVPPVGDLQRAQVYRWLVFLVCNLYETDLRTDHPERYTTDPNGIPGVAAAAAAYRIQTLELVERALETGPFFLQDRFSVVDIYLVTMIHWHADGDQVLGQYPRIKRLCEQVRERPSVQRIWDQNHPE